MEGLDEAQVAMEASYCRQPLHDRLEYTGKDVRLAHLMKTRAIAQAKTNKIRSTNVLFLVMCEIRGEHATWS